MSNYYVRCNKANICKATSSECHHSSIHVHDGDNSICFEKFKCPDANREICYCIPVSDEKAGLKKLIDPKDKLSYEENND